MEGILLTPSLKTQLLYLAEILMHVYLRPHLERSRSDEAFVRHQLGCQVDPTAFLIGNRIGKQVVQKMPHSRAVPVGQSLTRTSHKYIRWSGNQFQ